MPTQTINATKPNASLSWVQITLLVCGFWLIYLFGNTRNPLANYAAVSLYDVRSVAFSLRLVVRLLLGPAAGAIATLLLVTVVGGRRLWQALVQPVLVPHWRWLIPISAGFAALRWVMGSIADQFPWTWFPDDAIADIQWLDLRFIAVVALRELLMLIASWLILATLLVAFKARLSPSQQWLLYLGSSLLAAGLATTSAQPVLLGNLLASGVPVIAGVWLFDRWRNVWLIVLSYELVWRIINCIFVLLTW